LNKFITNSKIARNSHSPVCFAGVHIPVLDGIRGIAILMVIAYHFTIYGMGRTPAVFIDRLFYRVFTAGWCGVDLFFVLSGFLITGILLDAKGEKHFFRNFYLRRIFRIFPLYYGFLAVFFLWLSFASTVDNSFRSLLDQQGWYWTYLVNISIAVEGWPPMRAVGHFWSLAVEEQFYLFWPPVVFFCGRRQLMTICIMCLAGSFLVRVGFALAGNPLAAYVLTPARMDTFAVGAVIALVVRSPGGLMKLRHWIGPICIIAVVCLGTMFVWQRGLRSTDIVMQTIGYSILAATFGAMLVAALASPIESGLGKFFAHPVLGFFGHYSYGLYVFHHPVVLAMQNSFVNENGVPVLWGSQLPYQLLFLSLGMGMSTALALVSWHAYEVHFLKLKALFPHVVRGRPAVSTYAITPPSKA
jgi:peptidoglycan/LPS O-acetylase OafA/YrhL